MTIHTNARSCESFVREWRTSADRSPAPGGAPQAGRGDTTRDRREPASPVSVSRPAARPPAAARQSPHHAHPSFRANVRLRPSSTPSRRHRHASEPGPQHAKEAAYREPRSANGVTRVTRGGRTGRTGSRRAAARCRNGARPGQLRRRRRERPGRVTGADEAAGPRVELAARDRDDELDDRPPAPSTRCGRRASPSRRSCRCARRPGESSKRAQAALEPGQVQVAADPEQPGLRRAVGRVDLPVRAHPHRS